MSKRVLIVFFLLVLSVTTGCGGGDDGNSVDTRTGIGGVVVDGSPYEEPYYLRDVSPLPLARANAKVLVFVGRAPDSRRVAETTSDANGRFFVPLPPGVYGIYAERPPHAPLPEFCATGDSVKVAADQKAEIALGHGDCDRLYLAGRTDFLITDNGRNALNTRK